MGFYQRLLFRPPTMQELEGWILGSLDLGSIRELLEASDEFAAVGR
jgi:hypothetical protein